MKTLAPIYPIEPLEQIIWPNLSLNPFLNGNGLEIRDPGFQASLQKIMTLDSQARTRQSFAKWSDLDNESKKFIEEGILVSNQDITEISSLMSKHIDRVIRAKPVRDFRTYDRMMSFGANSPECKAVRRNFQGWGLTKIASNMIGKSVSVDLVVLQYSDAQDTHYKQVLSDCNYDSKLRSLHRDPKPNVKALLYLDEVRLYDGPFKYIPYSHRWECSYEERMASQANCTYNYLDSPTQRSKFLGLKKSQRITSIIGSVIDDSDPLSQTLLDKETSFLSEVGNVILFPASAMLHRGGIICDPKGKRLNLQITLR